MTPKEFETISEYVCKQTRWTDGSIRHDRIKDIVRCKECKHWAYGKDLCTLHDMGMMADDFCSYGEREGV